MGTGQATFSRNVTLLFWVQHCARHVEIFKWLLYLFYYATEVLWTMFPASSSVTSETSGKHSQNGLYSLSETILCAMTVDLL